MNTINDNAPPFALYNPGLLPPQVLLAEFTARRPLLARLLDIVRNNHLGEPPQHVLIVGPRGMGKTTLLCAIAGSIGLREPELRAHWQPVVFDEESRRIGDLADFWLECIRQWESVTEPTRVQSPRIDILLRRSPDEIEESARDVFLQLVDASGKRALLLIDNFNEVLSAVHDIEALRRLRAFLMADSRVMIVGAATRWFSEVTHVDKPFFEFFRNFELNVLDLEEMRACLAGVAEARGDQRVLDTLRDKPGSIRSLHILTGGNPRLIRTFYRLLNEGMNGELRHQLERLIDDYTPYVKAIIDALPGQQQRVLDAIALQWNPCEVSVVARITRLPSNQVSAQIKALVKAGLVSQALGSKPKKRFYLLTDRFSNIHYLMRHGRTGQLRMHWFVMTLRVLFDDDVFADAAAKTIRMTAASESSLDEGLSLAFGFLENAGSEKARNLLFDRIAGSRGHDDDINIDLALKVCENEIDRDPTDAYAHFKMGRLHCIHLKDFQAAEVAYRTAIRLNPDFAWAWNNLGILLSDLERHDEAEAAYRKAIDIDPKHASAWNNLGNLLYYGPRRHDEAEAALRKAIDIDPKDWSARNNLGYLLTRHLDRHDEAKDALLKAIELAPSKGLPHSNLGMVLGKLGDFQKSEREFAIGFRLTPNHAYIRNRFDVFCHDDSDSLAMVLPDVSRWCCDHPEDGDMVRFVMDTWIEYAKVSDVATAISLLEQQTEEVQLAFEGVRDALLAFQDDEHLHRLAPERRAPVMEFLERLKA